MKSKSVKTVWAIIMIALIVILSIGFLYGKQTKSKRMLNDIVPASDNNSSKKVTLYDDLVGQTALGQAILPQSKKESWRKFIRKIYIDRYYGAFLGVKNGRLTLSGSAGSANVATRATFKLNSTFFVGHYQEFIDSAILTKLIDDGKVKSSVTLGSIIPELNYNRSMTLQNFLTKGTGKYIDKNILEVLSSKSLASMDKVKLMDKPTKNSFPADSVITAVIISKVANKSYNDAIEEIFKGPLKITSVYMFDHSGEHYANNVTSYSYQSVLKKPVQQNVYQISDTYFGINQMKMTLSDAMYSYYMISDSKFFSEKYNRLFKKAIKKYGMNASKIDVETFNQHLIFRFDTNTHSATLIADNFPNKKFKTSEVSSQIEKFVQ